MRMLQDVDRGPRLIMYDTDTRTTIHSVTVVRTTKVCALICLILSLILLIIAMLTSSWVKIGPVSSGLLSPCPVDGRTSQNVGRTIRDLDQCYSDSVELKNMLENLGSKRNTFFEKTGTVDSQNLENYAKVSVALFIVVICLHAIGIFITLLGLGSRVSSRKYLYYRISLYFVLFSILLVLIALIVFPLCFYSDFENQVPSAHSPDLGWSYAVAWCSVAMTFCAALLIICDKEHEEVYYKEKTVHTSRALPKI
uniref:Uncharacterized protein n=1 Tax=Romanomermis culicivorax TaxID=13658 RepID=A0A915I9J1_ROMCU